ncbi:LysR family transcriptional regulator [Paramagnetospirillum marisnigri]|uniref:LysR family transcriptional regulator n=1 Tax=Paramagnetospirillum marisnigri TaxID=1285242 RepID=A0A178MSL6_9PROT|nr:hydrogen peroxide-inducible genes activator [Paramagnetospirillum marisnigri]OAN52380.1 LysR family transcriptional regulator [Paramagnetospirillum marisnigri]
MQTHLPTLRQLRYLVALAEHRHFGRAAEACSATQSTLSAGLQELETLLGTTLVERTKRRVLVTPLGEAVVARAREVLRGAEDITDMVRAAGRPLAGPLRLGVIPTIAPFLLPSALPALRRTFPDLKLVLREDLTARLLERLARGELDTALLALPYDAPDMEMLTLARDPFVLACRPDDPLAARADISGGDLAASHLLLLEEGHCLREHALAACSLASTNRGEDVMGTSLGTLVQMVASGLGVTLLPRLAVTAGILRGTDLVTRPLAGDGARFLGLVWRKSSPRAKEFGLLGRALFEGLDQS